MTPMFSLCFVSSFGFIKKRKSFLYFLLLLFISSRNLDTRNNCPPVNLDTETSFPTTLHTCFKSTGFYSDVLDHNTLFPTSCESTRFIKFIFEGFRRVRKFTKTQKLHVIPSSSFFSGRGLIFHFFMSCKRLSWSVFFFCEDPYIL